MVKLKSWLFLLAIGLCANSAHAAMNLLSITDVNDSDAAVFSGLVGMTTDELARVDWDIVLGDTQASAGLSVTTTTGSTTPTAGSWDYSGAGTVDYLAMRFNGWTAIFEVTDGDATGLWDTAAFGDAYMNAVETCSGSGRGQSCNTTYEAYDMSHITAYSVSAVPVPAAVWLFGSGLIGLVGMARRKKAA